MMETPYLDSADATCTPPANARVVKPAGRAELSTASHPAGQAWAVTKQPRSLPTGPGFAYHCIGCRLHGVPLGDSMTISCIHSPSSVAASMVFASVTTFVASLVFSDSCRKSVLASSDSCRKSSPNCIVSRSARLKRLRNIHMSIAVRITHHESQESFPIANQKQR